MFDGTFGKYQFAYRKGYSTTCAVIKLHDYATKYMDKTEVAAVRILSMDMSRAFETVPHDILLERMINSNFPHSIVKLMNSYLSDRSQRVSIYDFNTNWKKVTSSVPQGSVLRPKLFGLVMGTLKTLYDDTFIMLFSDDITMARFYDKI